MAGRRGLRNILGWRFRRRITGLVDQRYLSSVRNERNIRWSGRDCIGVLRSLEIGALASVLGQCLVRVCQIFGVLLWVSVFGAAYLLSGLAGVVEFAHAQPPVGL